MAVIPVRINNIFPFILISLYVLNLVDWFLFYHHTGCVCFLLRLFLGFFVQGLHFAWEDKMPCCVGLTLKCIPPPGDWLISKNTIRKNSDRLSIHFVLEKKIHSQKFRNERLLPALLHHLVTDSQ